MDGKSTYRAVLYGPGTIGSGEEVDLDYVDGAYQDVLVVETASEDGDPIVRSYRRGKPTDEEPIPYRFVEENDTGEGAVKN
jgi:hypothetical protein